MTYKLNKPFEPLRIGLDIDGVLSDFTTPYLKKLIELNGSVPEQCRNFDPKVDPNCWDWEKPYGFSHAVREEFWRWCKTEEGQREFWAEIPPLLDEDDCTYIRWLQTHNDVYFITTRPMMIKEICEEWIAQHYGEIRDRVPTVLLSHKAKGAVARGLQLHAMFDDKPFNVQQVLRECGLSCMPFLIDQPWNREFEDPYITRVYSIQAGMRLLEHELCRQ